MTFQDHNNLPQFRGKGFAPETSFSVGGPTNDWSGWMPSTPRLPMQDIDRRGAVQHTVDVIGDVKAELQRSLPNVMRKWIERPSQMTPILTYLMPKVFDDSLVRTLKTTEFNSDLIGIVPSRAPPPLVSYTNEYQQFTSVRRAQGIMIHHEFWKTRSGLEIFNNAMNHVATMLLFTLEAAAGMALLNAHTSKTNYAMLSKKIRVLSIEDMLALEASSFAAIMKGNDGVGSDALNALVSTYKSILNNGENLLPPTDIVLPYGLRFHESLKPSERDYSTSGPQALVVRERSEAAFNVVQGIRVSEIQPLRIKNRAPYELNVGERVREIGEHYRGVDVCLNNDGSYRTSFRSIRILDLDTALGEMVEISTKEMLKNCGRFDFQSSSPFPMKRYEMNKLASLLNGGNIQNELSLDPMKRKSDIGDPNATAGTHVDPLLYFVGNDPRPHWNVCTYLGDIEADYYTDADLESFADHAVQYFKACRAITDDDVKNLETGLDYMEELNNAPADALAFLVTAANQPKSKGGHQIPSGFNKNNDTAYGYGNIVGMRVLSDWDWRARNFTAALKKLWSLACELSPNNPALDDSKCPPYWSAAEAFPIKSQTAKMLDSITVFGQNLVSRNRANIFVKGGGGTSSETGTGNANARFGDKEIAKNIMEKLGGKPMEKMTEEESELLEKTGALNFPSGDYQKYIDSYGKFLVSSGGLLSKWFETSGLQRIYESSKKDGKSRNLQDLINKAEELAKESPKTLEEKNKVPDSGKDDSGERIAEAIRILRNESSSQEQKVPALQTLDDLASKFTSDNEAAVFELYGKASDAEKNYITQKFQKLRKTIMDYEAEKQRRGDEAKITQEIETAIQALKDATDDAGKVAALKKLQKNQSSLTQKQEAEVKKIAGNIDPGDDQNDITLVNSFAQARFALSKGRASDKGKIDDFAFAAELNYIARTIIEYDDEKGGVDVTTFSNNRLRQIIQQAKESWEKNVDADFDDTWTASALTVSETFWIDAKANVLNQIRPASLTHPHLPRDFGAPEPSSDDVLNVTFTSTKYSAKPADLGQPFSSKSKFKQSKGSHFVRPEQFNLQRHVELGRGHAMDSDAEEDGALSTYFTVNHNMAARFKHASGGAACSVYHRVFMLLWIFMPIDGDQLMRLLDKNMRFPFDFLIERPFMKMHMGSGIISSGPVGSTVIGNILLESSDDAAHQEHFVHFSFHHGTDVSKKNRYLVMQDIYCCGYVAGGGTQFITPSDITAQQNNYNGKSLLCYMVPKGHLQNGSPLPRVADVHDWRGRYDHGIFADVIPSGVTVDKRSSHWIGAFFENMRFNSITNSTAHLGPEFGNQSFNIDPAHQNSITWQGHQQHYNDKQCNWSIVVLNKGHLGTEIQPGFRKMMQGGPNRVQKTNNSENAIAL